MQLQSPSASLGTGRLKSSKTKGSIFPSIGWYLQPPWSWSHNILVFISLYPSGVSFILREGHHLIWASTLSTVQNTCKKNKNKKTKSQIFHHLRINIIFPVLLKRLVNKQINQAKGQSSFTFELTSQVSPVNISYERLISTINK